MEDLGALVVYVDLWSNKSADPSELVAKEVLERLSSLSPTKWMSGIEGVQLSVAGVGLSVNKEEKTKDLTFTEALSQLSLKTQKKIVLIIDEFQHALSTQKGEEMLFALKAARDELNSSKYHGMCVLGTGSNQDKLAALRNSKDQAFYLTPLTHLPYLDKKFTDWLVEVSGMEIDKDVMWLMFQKADYKPEIINGVLRELQLTLELSDDVSQIFQDKILRLLERDLEDQKEKIKELPLTQWAILAFLASNQEKYGLQSKKAHMIFEDLAKRRGETVKFDTSVVQSSINALQKKKFIWSSARGTYHIEDEKVTALLKEMTDELSPPPSLKPKR